jgi:hypothetical protein
MRSIVAALACVPLAIAAPSADAQRANFSGTWVRVVDSSASRTSVATAGDAGFRVGDPGSGWGSPLTITQRPDSLILEYVFFSAYDLQPPVRLAYAMNGGFPTTNGVMIGHATSERIGMVKWGADFTTLLVVEIFETPWGVAPVGNGEPSSPTTVTHTLALVSPMTLEIRSTRRTGAAGSLATVTTTYTRR